MSPSDGPSDDQLRQLQKHLETLRQMNGRYELADCGHRLMPGERCLVCPDDWTAFEDKYFQQGAGGGY